ncbi:MAG: hypothetical protein AAF934_01555 [Bacteroidota bacterium]
MQLIGKKNKSTLLLILITGLFVIEFLATIYLHYSNANTTRMVGVYKLILELFLFLTISPKHFFGKIQYSIVFLIVIYLANQLLNPSLLSNLEFHLTKGSIYYLNKYIFIFIFILSFSSLENPQKTAQSLLKIIEYALFINIILMIFGVVSDIGLFRSYPKPSDRFGSDGMFNKVNETSYFYIILMAHTYYKIICGKEKIYKLIIIIVAGLLLGTKAILFFLGLLLLLHFVFVSRIKRLFRIALIPMLVLGILFFETSISFLFELSPFWSNLKPHYSLTTLLFSTRDMLLIDNLTYISQNWGFINYWIGGPYYTLDFFNIEMDLPDLILFFGTIGTIVYLSLLKIIYFKNNSFLVNSLLLLVILTGFLAGGMFLSVMTMIYLYLFKIAA